jgi:hypothetical protein
MPCMSWHSCMRRGSTMSSSWTMSMQRSYSLKRQNWVMHRVRIDWVSVTSMARCHVRKIQPCPFITTYVGILLSWSLMLTILQNIAAQQNHRDACFALTAWYLVGSPGVLPQSDTEAFLWAKKAADAGLAKAMYAVGYFLEVGIGTAPSMSE